MEGSFNSLEREIVHSPGFQEAEEPKTAPHNLGAEQALLGSILYENAIFHDIGDTVRAERFYDPIHARIFGAIAERIEAGKLADAVTLKHVFEKDAGLAEIGGVEYLSLLLDNAMDAPAAREYAKIVVETAEKRELDRVLASVSARLDEHSARDLIEEAETALAEIADQEEGEAEYGAGEALRAALRQAADDSRRVVCGLRDVDDALGGFRPGKLYIIAGRSSMGKSALGGSICRRVASNGFASLFLSLEMPSEEVAARWAAEIANVPYFAILRNTVMPENFQRVTRAAEELDQLPLTVADVPGAQLSAIRSRIRRWKRAQQRAGRPVGVVAVDFLQLIRQPGASLYERATEVAKGLQTLARTLDVPLIALSQLSRASEAERDKRPAIRHLRDSGAIEEAADAIMLVYRDAYYAEREPEEADPGKEAERRMRAGSKEVEVDLAKNRQGPLSKIKLVGDLPTNSFRDWE